ncbi:MAG TPA: glycerate kinase [Streptosporangiaceae bacterium]|nr:glycerate kinase [Streptosporangiaceae bacterium]
MTRVVLAPDKFKGSASAAEVARALAAGLRAGRPDLDIVALPVADGGEGTLDAAASAGYTLVPVTAEGPTGRPVATAFALREDTAVVELADVTGLRRLPGPLAPLTASTYGVGQVISAALDRGATKLVLGIGGSASTDGGAGLLQALGLGLFDAGGAELGRGGAALASLDRIDLSGLDSRPANVLVASDVDNPLLGDLGAAVVFGPQKGATPAEVALLDAALARWAALTKVATGRDVATEPGAGAAGGAGFGALAYLGARLVRGVELVLDLIGFEAAVAGADLVIAGEGSLDAQSMRGKAPVGVAKAAARAGIPVVAVAGRVLLSQPEVARAGFAAVYSLADLAPDPVASMANAEELLHEVGCQIAARHLR